MKLTERKLLLYLPNRLYRHLKASAQQKRISLSAYLRGLLEEDLGNGAPEEDPLFALLRNKEAIGPPDGSRHVDKYLYGGT